MKYIWSPTSLPNWFILLCAGINGNLNFENWRQTNGGFKVWAIVLYYFGIVSILLDPAVPEILYLKHHIRASLIIIVVGNPDVDNIGDAILVTNLRQLLNYAKPCRSFSSFDRLI